MNPVEIMLPDRALSWDWSHVKILVVEDFPELCELFDFFLSSLGVQFKIVTNGSEALEAVKRESFDIILMDLGLPVIDGETAMKILRKNGTTIPIIAMTGYSMDPTQEPFLAGQFDDCLAKPFNLKGLTEKLEKHLTKQSLSIQKELRACPKTT